MSDTIIFMSAYETTRYSKSKLFKRKQNQKSDVLLKNHHMDYILLGNKLISQKGTLRLHTEYDYVQQKTTFSFKPVNEKQDIKDFEEILENTGFESALLHKKRLNRWV